MNRADLSTADYDGILYAHAQRAEQERFAHQVSGYYDWDEREPLSTGWRAVRNLLLLASPVSLALLGWYGRDILNLLQFLFFTVMP